MDEEARKALYEKAIELWGVPAQVMMVMEETGELLSALGKFDRRRASEADVITELADVAILVEQMAIVFGLDDFKKEKERKLERLKERLDKSFKLREEKQEDNG